ncbi:alpha/beta-hydrolase [Mycena galopus ATCC 62051]|nr:alpha/beta-hydrolase [Mycena galopus ATCC 62051]
MDCLDVCYKQIGQLPVHLNVYAPNLKSQTPYPRLPAVVYFHGGGLTVGNRTSWFPSWLKARMVAAGFVFISADYRLLPSCSVHEIIDDIKDLFLFLSQDNLCFKTESGSLFGIDPASLAVAGSSAGGMCAYLAAIHVAPIKLRAVLGMYAMGGQIFSSHCLTPKTKVFYRNRELVDPEEFPEFLYPRCKSLETIADSALAYHPASHPTRPGWWANPRMALARLYLQLGVMIDYCTGQHEPSLSAQLRPLLDTTPDPIALQEAMKARIPPEHHAVFPQLNVTAQFPPTFLCHGSEDGAVSVEESHHMHLLLKRAGVSVQLLVIEGANHSLDYVPDAEQLYASHFDEMAEFLRKALKS